MCSIVFLNARRQRDLPLANALMWATFFCGFWSFSRFIAYASLDLTIKEYWHKTEYFGIVTLPVATLAVALHYTGRGHWITRRRLYIAAIIPTISLILILTTEMHGLMWRERLLTQTQWGPMPYSKYGAWFLVHTCYSYVCTLFGSALILMQLWQSPKAYHWQAFNIFLALLTPIIANLGYFLGIQPVWFDLTPSAFAITMALFMWDISYLRLFDLAPIAHHVIFEMLDDGVIVLNQQNCIVDMNPAASRLLGFDMQNSVGRKFEELLPDWRRVVSSGSLANTTELLVMDQQDRPHWFQVRTRCIKHRPEGSAGSVIVLHDITTQKQDAEALAIARDEAMEANRFKTQLLGKISHDLRTPLSVIMGYAELLQRPATAKSTINHQAAASTIIDYTRHLSRLVTDLLDAAQLEAGRITLNNSLFSVQELVDQVMDQNVALAHVKKINLTYTIEAELPAMLMGDPDRLRQILNNLVSNAIKFTDQGKVHIHLYRAADCQWAIQVTDTGRGIPACYHTEIFEPFQQLDPPNSSQHSGHGLGLAIVQQLTRIMQGKVTIESEEGKGSTFTVLLPLVTRKERKGDKETGRQGRRD